MSYNQWLDGTREERVKLARTCLAQGHDYRYIEGTDYQWDCARCNWTEFRLKPSLPLLPSMPYGRWRTVDQWAETPATKDWR